MIFIGPSFPGGIAYHTFNYKFLFPNSKHYTLVDEIPECDHAIVFALPVDVFWERYEYLKSRVKKITCMTVCETETVHKDFGRLMKEFKRVAVPSEFCRRIFAKQFPENEFFVVRAYIPPPPTKPYTFYTIGNIKDKRKNVGALLRAFMRLENPNARLVLKTQSNNPVNFEIPNVQIINEQFDDDQMERLHTQCDCYVNSSHSEGVGMGVIEAAVRDKPVIIVDYGGTQEYVKTPYIVSCNRKNVGEDYYLFKKDMIWGEPNEDELYEYMKDVLNKNIRYMDHSYTKNYVSSQNVIRDFENI